MPLFVSRCLAWGLWPRWWQDRECLDNTSASTWVLDWVLQWGFTLEGKSQVEELVFVKPFHQKKSFKVITSRHHLTDIPHALLSFQGLTWMQQCHSQCVHLAAWRGRCCLSMFLHSFWGHFLQRGQFLPSIMVYYIYFSLPVYHRCISVGSRISKSTCLFNVVSICRSHTWLLWRKPDSNWCKGHSWYLCHLSGTVPLLAGWIHWPGSHETRLKDYSYESLSSVCTNHFLYFIVSHTATLTCISVWRLCCVCVPGVWHSYAAALPNGSDRPEEQTGRGGQRACHSGSPGVAHWDFPGQQQWLCHQPHQRHCTQDLHCHSRLGDWCV